MTFTVSHRFPDPIFAVTCLSKWARLDITVRCCNFPLCLHTQRIVNKSYAVCGENPLPFLSSSLTPLASYFFTHPQTRSWNNPWPIRPPVCLDGTHQRLSLYPCFKYFILPVAFPRLFLRFSHAHTHRWIQFKFIFEMHGREA